MKVNSDKLAMKSGMAIFVFASFSLLTPVVFADSGLCSKDQRKVHRARGYSQTTDARKANQLVKSGQECFDCTGSDNRRVYFFCKP